ncbi:MAG TPA: cytochrome b/b6 domain-containing protein [Sphingomicrobium sp.]|nr:cytochrome b/b6 domain-containing protein [Sphingomicrobium sp.]
MDRPTYGEPGALVRRHRLSTRIWHWINALAVIVLLMSGLMILDAHPRLYWGEYGANFDRAWLELPRFPGWLTIPSTYDLAGARRWHLAFAWLFVAGILFFLVTSALNRHLWRDLVPRRNELAPAHIWADIRDHARLRFPTGEAALRYSLLQKLSYALVVFLLLPAMILSGLAMSPAMDAAWPWLLDLFGGRQSARSVHFLSAAAIALFLIVHLLMVMLAGPVNEIRSMITGRFRVPEEAPQ